MSVKPESVEHLGEASLRPGLPVKEGEGELVVVGNPHAPTRRGSSLEPEKEVTPINDETVVEKVFRLMGDKILELAISDGPVGWFYPSRELALRYRLVCRDWRDIINSIYPTSALPLFEYTSRFYNTDLDDVERMTRNLKSLTSLFAPPTESSACSGVVPPVSLGCNLSCPPIFPLETKVELEATALNTLRQMGRMLLTLKLKVPNYSLEGMNCFSLDLPNLKHAEFILDSLNNSTPGTIATWKIVNDILKAATSLQTLIIENGPPRVSTEMPELELPKSIEKLELRWIRIPMWLIDIAPTLKNVRQLVLKLGDQRLSEEEPACHMENRLINKLSKYLEVLELKQAGSWLLSDSTNLYQPTFLISEPMPNLRTLKFEVSSWKLGKLKSYKELLPSLTDLEVSVDQRHFSASWYESPCSTLRRLCLVIFEESSETFLFSQQTLGEISQRFPNLNKLDVSSDKCADDNWQSILCQGFPNLRKLKMECGSVSAEGRNRLVSAVTGIPLEELQAIFQGEKELEHVINNCQHCPSLRDLTNLEFLWLKAYGLEEDEDGQFWREDTDSSVMVYSTFLRMPNLNTVVLSSMFQLTDELKQHAKNETGLDIHIF